MHMMCSSICTQVGITLMSRQFDESHSHTVCSDNLLAVRLSYLIGELSHFSLLSSELRKRKIKILSEMVQNLMILHSYILVKVSRVCCVAHDRYRGEVLLPNCLLRCP